MSYQFIVISSTAERHRKMKEQFTMLEKAVNVHYLEASMISNSKDYLHGYNDETKFKFICCARSHIRALEYATISKSICDFSIILEDDAAFYKEGFLALIEEIIGNWHEYEIHKMISIGWIPCQGFNYSDFLKINRKYTQLTAVPGTKVTYKYYLPGLQGYIVKNSDIPYMEYLLQPTYIEFCNKMKSWQHYLTIQKKFGTDSIDKDLIAVDCYLNMLFNHAAVFPPLLIEQDVPSLLGHKNSVYWDVFFKKYESERTKYMFY